jgi:2-keto-4-pentenoate hydratase/2-oxohepta-3-ene-1,7-dioic acid hydratase in catechol pathway
VRLVRFQQKAGENRIGVMVGANHLAEITGVKTSFEPILDFLKDPKAESKAQLATDSAKMHFDEDKQDEKGYWSLDSVTVLPPIAHPTKIICMGGNFSDHLAEGSSSLPPFPISFLKAPTSCWSPGASNLSEEGQASRL